MDKKHLRDEFVTCRTFSHSWEEFNPTYKRGTFLQQRMSLQCTRCTTIRYDDIDSLGRVSNRQYVYPQDYQLAESVGRHEFRLEYIRRQEKSSRLKAVN